MFENEKNLEYTDKYFDIVDDFEYKLDCKLSKFENRKY